MFDFHNQVVFGPLEVGATLTAAEVVRPYVELPRSTYISRKTVATTARRAAHDRVKANRRGWCIDDHGGVFTTSISSE